MEMLGNATSLFTTIPLDWIFFGGVIIAVALDSLRSGVGRALAISIALPISLLLFSLLQESAFLSSSGLFSTPYAEVVALAILVVAMYILVRRMGLDFVDGGMGEPIQAIMAGGAVVVVFACMWLQEPVLSQLWTLSDQIQNVFAESFRFFWLVGAYAALAFARG
jgi:hypothetical protein